MELLNKHLLSKYLYYQMRNAMYWVHVNYVQFLHDANLT